MPPRNLDNMTPEELAAKVDALSPVWAKDYIRRLENLTRTLHAQLTEARQAVSGVTEIADHAREELRRTEISGLPPLRGDYATARVLDGRADMEPIADLPEGAEIRFVNWYQVHYGAHESTAEERVLVIEGDGPLIIRPVSQGTILVTRS